MSFNDLTTFVDLSGKNILCNNVYAGFTKPEQVGYNTVLPQPLGGGGGSGSVTSVGLSAPSQFTVSQSPVTTVGTLGLAWNNQSANTVLAGPTGGGSAAPTFRSIVSADLPNFSSSQSGAAPASGGGSVNFLRADGTWAVPSGGAAGGSNGQVQYNNAGAFGGLTNTQLTANINTFTSTLSGAAPASGGGTNNFLRADGSWVVPPGGGGSSDFFNVKSYGATGNGVTDDTTAINNAIAAIATAGGGILYFPPGTYACGTINLGSNTIMMGAGMGATTIHNNGSAGFEVISIAWTMSGNSSNWPNNNTTYSINTPSNYTNQVTLTTHSQASNFTVGQWALVSGGLQGTSFWFPSWFGKVTAANSSTGVVTFDEEIPFEGALLNTIQVVTAIPQNIVIRDMTLIASLDSCISCFGVQNMLVENVEFYPWPAGGSPGGNFSNGLCVIGQAKNSGMRNCISHASGYELFGASHCFMDSCRCTQGQYNNNGTITKGSTLLIDGGSADCSITNNFIIADPTSPATNWIEVENSPIRNKIIGNTITGMPDGCQGISVTDNNNPISPVVVDQNNSNIVMGNTILGSGTQTTSIGISTSSGVCFGNVIENVALGIFGTGTANVFFDGNIFKNVNDQGWLSNPPGQPGTNSWVTTQTVGQKTLASASATPSVAGGGYFSVSQSGAQTITNLVPYGPTSNEVESQAGQEILLFFTDNHTTLSHAAGGMGQMNFVGGAGFTPASNTFIKFVLNPFGVWMEQFRSSSGVT